MIVKTEELTGSALDWAVAKSDDYLSQVRIKIFKEKAALEDLGRTNVSDDNWTYYSPSEDWAQGGPIIDREKIDLHQSNMRQGSLAIIDINDEQIYRSGETALIAAMRCFVASKFGNEIDVPDALATIKTNVKKAKL